MTRFQRHCWRTKAAGTGSRNLALHSKKHIRDSKGAVEAARAARVVVKEAVAGSATAEPAVEAMAAAGLEVVAAVAAGLAVEGLAVEEMEEG